MSNRSRLAFAGAASGAVFMALTWLVAIHTGVGQHADQSVLRGFQDLGRPRVDSLARFIARLCNPSPWLYFAAVPVVVALVRRRPRVAIALVAMLVGANATTQLLKPLLATTRAHDLLPIASTPVSPASWPSGHATAAMSLALACVLAAPARWRGAVAALGAAFAVAVSYSFLTLGWHYPSDVLGGFLIAGIWALGAVGVLFVLDARPARRPAAPARVSAAQVLRPVAATLIAALLLAAVMALSRPHAVASYVRGHQAFTVGAAAIGLLGLVVASVVGVVWRPQR
jgi:membrane-associated phospholipid phosphatase